MAERGRVAFLGYELKQFFCNANAPVLAACAANGVPAIAAMGRKGGSTVAAAVCNALVYSAAEMLDPAARGWK